MTTLLLLAPRADAYAGPLRRAFPSLRLVAAECEEGVMVAEAAGLIALPAPTAGFLAAHPRLTWLQTLTAGTDHLAHLTLPAYVTSLRGIHAPQMTELALLFMLALPRNVKRMLRNQDGAVWERWPQPLLEGKTVVITGLGSIGEVLAARCAALGMRVMAVSGTRRAVPHVAAIDAYDDLPRAVAVADFVVVLTPATAATRHVIDASVLAAMKRTAYLINLARGAVVDEGALTDALRAGRIAGAGLDVFASEPLPAASELWRMPNVMVTPHIGGLSDCYADQAMAVLAPNVSAFLAGEPWRMRNLVRQP